MTDAPSRAPAPTTAVRLLRILLAASLVLPATVFVATVWQDRRLLVAGAEQRAESSAEILEQHASAAFHAYELIFARVDEHLRTAPDESEAARQAYLAGIDHGLKEVGSLFLVDANGSVTAHSRYAPPGPVSVADRDYFRMLAPVGNHPAAQPEADAAAPPLDASGLAVGEPNIGRLSGKTKLNIARAVLTADGRFAGAIVISVAQEYFESFHQTLASSGDDSLALLRADGALLARSPALTSANLRRLAGSENAQAVLGRMADGNVVAFTSPLDGIERIASYRKLAAYPIYVGYGVGMPAVLRVWHLHVAVYGVAALVTGLVLFAVTWLALRAAQEEAQVRADLVCEMGRRQAAEAALRQAQKMEAMGQLTGGVAHDFNNLLAAVTGNLELLGKRLPADARLARYLDGALEGARRGAGLTQRMLAFARRQDLKLEAVDVPTLVRGMANLLDRSLGPAVAVDTRFPVRLAPARVDANQLEASLLNLAVNARDAMPNGGRIVVEAHEDAVGLGSPLGLGTGRYVVLTVSDTGEGMDAATLARAAEPFFTTKPVGKGTGLGLAMVHGLAAQSGGTLHLASVPGQGTSVSIWLPVAAEAPAPLPAAAVSRRATPARRILLVDDDRLVRDSTRAMLDDLGHDVVAVGSAPEALALLEAGAAVDLVVTDHVMPGMKGSELAARLGRLRPGLPVLLASGYADLSEAEGAQWPRLAKPFTQAALADAVAALTEQDAHGSTFGPTVVALKRRAGRDL